MVRVDLRFTEAQAAKVRRMADRENVSVSEVLRRLLDAAPEIDLLPDREELKRRALAAVGCADMRRGRTRIHRIGRVEDQAL